MTATNRPKLVGPPTVRDPDDHYETPPWAVEAIWKHVRPITGHVLDPCAGRGALLEVIRKHYVSTLTHAVELDRGRYMQLPGPYKRNLDWLASDSAEIHNGAWPHLVITNPPYKLALPFVQKALRVTQPVGGEVCMLLRLNFLGSQKRAAWLRDHTPDVYVLPRRPSFAPDGKTDSTEYAWMVWGPTRRAKLHILEVSGAE